MKSSRRSFLQMLGVATVAPVIPKMPEPASDVVVGKMTTPYDLSTIVFNSDHDPTITIEEHHSIVMRGGECWYVRADGGKEIMITKNGSIVV